jgi:hypothetical protein
MDGEGSLSVSLADVLAEGRTDLMGMRELVIEGDSSQSIALDGDATWSSAGEVEVGGAHYAVYVDPLHQAKLLVNDKINVVL